MLVGSAAGADTGGAGPATEAAQAGAASGSAPEPLQLMGPVGKASPCIIETGVCTEMTEVCHSAFL